LNIIFCGQLNTYQQIGSYGKSGSVFFYTYDAQFMVKTVTEREAMCLWNNLKSYYEHVTDAKTALVPIIGLHKLENKSTKMFVIVMKNLFTNTNEIQSLYDMKGSEYGRFTLEQDRKPGVPLKDLDFKRTINLNKNVRTSFLEQLERDANFLCNTLGVMDYSLLTGIHKVVPTTIHPDSITMYDCRNGLYSSDGSEIFYMGIIDYLVPFGMRKFLEINLKGIYIIEDKHVHLSLEDTFNTQDSKVTRPIPHIWLHQPLIQGLVILP